jgi:ATP-dependent DNA helicase RecQ
LIHKGLLVQNIMRHLVLQLTEAARPILRGDAELLLAVPRTELLNTRKLKRRELELAQAEDASLFRELRKLRKQLSEDEGVPPYVVFNDATLLELAQYKPTTEAEMLNINGIGHRKLERYGALFLECIREYAEF